MATSTNVSLASLDFDSVKQNLITFLQAQTQFQDYNFTGSNLNVLLDVLAFNDTYLATYLNMLASEMFLDSANLRDSVVSIVKELGYVPKSRVSATAVINLLISPPLSPPPPATIVIPQYTQFTASVNNTNYIFVTDVAYTASLNINTNTYTVNNITLKEGIHYRFTYTVNNGSTPQRFIIPNSNVDTSTIQVRIQNSTLDTTVNVFSLAGDITGITGTSNVYFIEEVENEQYQIYFGDGVLGTPLVNGNLVIIDYIVCDADAPNFANQFTVNQPINGYSSVRVTTVTAAYGGNERESIQSVKFNAPKNYETQNRAVTVNDYESILLQNYPNINSLAIWGGEDNVPPVYGKVFISLQPSVGYVITEVAKEAIVNDILQPYNVLTVIPEIIDPQYIFLTFNVTIKYDPSLTTLSAGSIQAEVLSTITNFINNNVNKFNTTFYFSNLIGAIDLTDTSIVSNVTNIQMEQRVIPNFNQIQSFTINFGSNNPIRPGSITSSSFISNALGFNVIAGDTHSFIDDGNGNIEIIKTNGSVSTVVKTNAGTVDYTNGIISITALDPVSIVNNVNYVAVYCVPVSPDVVPSLNYIVTLDPNAITINTVTVSS